MSNLYWLTDAQMERLKLSVLVKGRFRSIFGHP